MASIAATTTEVFLPQYSLTRSTLRRPSVCAAFSSKPIIGGGVSMSIQATPKSNFNTVVVSEKKDRSSFAQTSAVRHLVGSLTKPEGLRFAVVVARFNEVVTRLLLDGALETFKRYSVKEEDVDGMALLLDGALETFKRYSVKEEDVDVVWVPGCFEIPLAAERLGKLGQYNAVICIGAVVRGDTSHYDAVANSTASGVLAAGLSSGVPCIFGVLTCDNMDQAIDRSGGKVGNKGSEAALTAIEMASVFEHQLKK